MQCYTECALGKMMAKEDKGITYSCCEKQIVDKDSFNLYGKVLFLLKNVLWHSFDRNGAQSQNMIPLKESRTMSMNQLK